MSEPRDQRESETGRTPGPISDEVLAKVEADSRDFYDTHYRLAGAMAKEISALRESGRVLREEREGLLEALRGLVTAFDLAIARGELNGGTVNTALSVLARAALAEADKGEK